MYGTHDQMPQPVRSASATSTRRVNVSAWSMTKHVMIATTADTRWATPTFPTRIGATYPMVHAAMTRAVRVTATSSNH